MLKQILIFLSRVKRATSKPSPEQSSEKQSNFKNKKESKGNEAPKDIYPMW